MLGNEGLPEKKVLTDLRARHPACTQRWQWERQTELKMLLTKEFNLPRKAGSGHRARLIQRGDITAPRTAT